MMSEPKPLAQLAAEAVEGIRTRSECPRCGCRLRKINEPDKCNNCGLKFPIAAKVATKIKPAD
jgi:hypothetical protein